MNIGYQPENACAKVKHRTVLFRGKSWRSSPEIPEVIHAAVFSLAFFPIVFCSFRSGRQQTTSQLSLHPSLLRSTDAFDAVVQVSVEVRNDAVSASDLLDLRLINVISAVEQRPASQGLVWVEIFSVWNLLALSDREPSPSVKLRSSKRNIVADLRVSALTQSGP